jgi:hypothetical protein
VVVVATAGVARADEPRAEMQVDGRPHVGMPFTLSLATEGFAESPQPETTKLDIPGAIVTALGATPNVSRGVQIVNGHRSEFTSVRWSFSWRIVAAKEGTLHVPAVTVTQAGKRAVSHSGEVNVESVPTTDDMKIQLSLPDRAVFVGENVPVTLTWLFKNQPQGNPSFEVPLFDTDAFTVDFPQATTRRALPFTAGGKELQLPYDLDEVEVNGAKYNRVRVTVYAAPRKTGKVTVAPATVACALPTGRPDFFGSAPSKLFRATDVAHTLEVKTLPETDRPAGFAGAVGKEFTIAVATSRSVVQLGEPVTLDITIKSKQRLDTLALPRLDGDGGLPKDKFTVPADAPTGVLSDDGTTKTFKVTAQVTAPTNEIPAIAFSYFDPEKERYVTTHSDPIALSVKGGSVIGAGDVVAPAAKKSPIAAASSDTDVSVGNVDLALSAADADNGPLQGSVLWVVVLAFYAVPLALLGYRSWQLRTQTRREEASEVKAARKRIEAELARAQTLPARDAAGPLGAALRALARTLDRSTDDDGGLLADLETIGFAPDPDGKPLSSALRGRADALAKRWLADERRPSRAATSATGAAVALLVAIALPGIARADAMSEGRAAYQDAMSTSNPSQRKAAFARAAASLGDAARSAPDRAELLTDWGNAALGAGDVATATLAYRRALLVDPSAARAAKNLGWLRSRAAEKFQPEASGATDTLLFFLHWSRAQRLVTGGVAFAIAILLVVPWTGRRRRGLVAVAIVPAIIWLAMVGSILFEARHGDDAIVMEGVMLRAADSAGAPAALGQALPPGTEISVIERRDSWTRVRVAAGTPGWVPDGAIEMVRKR